MQVVKTVIEGVLKHIYKHAGGCELLRHADSVFTSTHTSSNL